MIKLIKYNTINPQVADFGLARFANDDSHTHVSTRVMGTFGYVLNSLYGYYDYSNSIFFCYNHILKTLDICMYVCVCVCVYV